MQPDQSNISRIHELVQKAVSGVIVMPVNPSLDALAAATAIYLALTKLGKTVNLVSETSPKSDLIASDKVQNELTTAGDNLVISFPYTEGAIDKVDYNIQGESFNLIITPRPGNPKLNPEQIKYSYSGGMIDFIITVDAPNLNSLGKIFTENKEQIQGKTIINIDRHLVNDFYGLVNLVNKTSSSTSELALRFIKEVGAELDKDMATNLYTGLTTATNNFTSYSVNADTFETAAALLKAGAIKKQLKKPGIPQTMPTPPSFMPKKPIPTAQPHPIKENNSQIPQPIRYTHTNEQQAKPIELVEQEKNDQEGNDSSQDWLKPKIFRGTGLL